jgi:hypothetical protein
MSTWQTSAAAGYDRLSVPLMGILPVSPAVYELTEGLRPFEVEDRFEPGRRLHRQGGGLVAAQDAPGADMICECGSVGQAGPCWSSR